MTCILVSISIGFSFILSVFGRFGLFSTVCAIVTMPKQPTPEQQRATAARKKYVELAPGRFVVNYYSDAAIRPIDLASRDPDWLKEFHSEETVVAFEEECYLKRKELLAKKESIAAYNRIPRLHLTICRGST